MPQSPVPHNPFGTTITTENIIDALGFFDTWNDRYKYIIDLGRELPAMDESKKDDDHLVRGCQSRAWIDTRFDNEHLWFEVDSDAFIVKGLLAVVLAAYNGKTAADILAFNIDDYFAKLELINHLSTGRGNGLRALVERIRSAAASPRAVT